MLKANSVTKNRKRYLALIYLVISLFALGFIADDPFEAMLAKWAAYQGKNAPEKVALHLDKPYYAVGDIIWFKAYVINAQTLKPTDKSKILYVDLINEKDSVERQLKLKMEQGITWGDFALPDSLQEGNYRIRSYTSWMLNEKPEFYYEKTIKVGNAFSNDVFTTVNYTYSVPAQPVKVSADISFTDRNGAAYGARPVSYTVQIDNKNILRGSGVTSADGKLKIDFLPAKQTFQRGQINATIRLADKERINKVIPIQALNSKPDVQFFPESGNMVANIPVKLAIKALAANGLGKDVSGKIYDGGGVEVQQFQTTYLGMGNVLLTPEAGKNYYALVKMDGAVEQRIDLPPVKSSGFGMSVSTADSLSVNLRIFLSGDQLNKGELKLVAFHNGDAQFVTRMKTDKQVTNIVVPKKELPNGIIQLTLFTGNNAVAGERLIFNDRNTGKIEVRLNSLKDSYAKREKVETAMMASFEGDPVSASFSIAVTNTADVTPDIDHETNIFTQLLLTGDLTGNIERPNYYFNAVGKERNARLDNLLLTQGWRRVSMGNFESAKPLSQPEDGLSISGVVTGKGGKVMAKFPVKLLSVMGGFLMIDTLTDANGRFKFANLDYVEGTQFLVRAKNEKQSGGIKVILDEPRSAAAPVMLRKANLDPNVNSAMMGYLVRSNEFFKEQVQKGLLESTIQIEAVRINADRRNMVPNSRNLNGPGRANHILLAKDLVNARNLTSFLNGRFPDVYTRNGFAYSRRAIRGLSNNAASAMDVYVDGIKMIPMTPDDSPLEMINLQDVEAVEILSGIQYTAMYATRSGVILITKKRGKDGQNIIPPTPASFTFVPKGYYLTREFYSPAYDVTPDTRPDYRSTIFWEPNFIITEENKGKFSYFTADRPGIYRIVVEGIDIDGNLARSVFQHEVK